MINIKEIIEDYKAMGYTHSLAVHLAKEEYKKRKRTLAENNKKTSRTCRWLNTEKFK